ncbi:MAG: SpoIIE family protein phosphatase [Proteobacteria bacterium]|nr:SpoIIE family protein phosphatase [Burkholderiales bacterium]
MKNESAVLARRVEATPYCIALNVIVLDARAGVRRNLSTLVKAVGASVVVAADAADAYASAARGEADVVLCGVDDGGALLKALNTERARGDDVHPWTAVALVPEAMADHDVEALEGIADDFLQLPLNAANLTARLRMYARTRSHFERLNEQQTLLQRHEDEAEDKRIASHLLARLNIRDPATERMMHAWVSPAQHLSGDVVAIARAPDDRLNLLLADATGHGLAAAISVLPVTEVFHRMTERGFDVSSMVGEMNRKIRSFMPGDRFVAAVVASIDMRERVIEVWNGGCPSVLLLGADGAVAQTWPSRHLALGIVEGADFDASVQRFAYHDACQLMMVSDGLSEAPSAGGRARFGDTAMLEAALGPSARRLQRVVSALQRFTGGKPLDDDASVMLVHCQMEPPAAPLDVVPVVRDDVESAWSVELTLGAAQLRRLALVPFVNGILDQMDIAAHARSDVFCVLSELLGNGLDYGVLGLEPGLRHQGDEGRQRFWQQREMRLANLSEGTLSVRVALGPAVAVELGLETEPGTYHLVIAVEDSGSGFDVQALGGAGRPTPVRSHQRAGRGFELVRSLCDALYFENHGRRVIARIPITRPG